VSKNGSAGLKGWRDDVIKEYTNMHKHLLIMYTSTESPKSKCRMSFFIANYMTSRVFRGFERLSCSFWRRVMASYSQRWNSPQISIFGSKSLTIFCFLSHNFRSRYASNSVKGSKDSFSSQESKKIERKEFRIGLGPRARQSWPEMAQTCSHCDVTHKEPKIQAEKLFFTISSRRFAESVEGLINSPALLVGKLWLAKVCP